MGFPLYIDLWLPASQFVGVGLRSGRHKNPLPSPGCNVKTEDTCPISLTVLVRPIFCSLYVSACESGRVYVWDAIKRRLLRTCSVGFPARSVSIQPGPNENQHIAVGGKFGQVNAPHCNALMFLSRIFKRCLGSFLRLNGAD